MHQIFRPLLTQLLPVRLDLQCLRTCRKRTRYRQTDRKNLCLFIPGIFVNRKQATTVFRLAMNPLVLPCTSKVQVACKTVFRNTIFHFKLINPLCCNGTVACESIVLKVKPIDEFQESKRGMLLK